MGVIKRILHDRALHKAISWRIIAVIITMSVVYVLTGSILFAGEIGALDTVFKIGLFWAHEKAWDKIDEKADSDVPSLPEERR